MIVGYYEDGPNLISMAMNGWGAAEPAWWLNLQAHPEAVVELAGDKTAEMDPPSPGSAEAAHPSLPARTGFRTLFPMGVPGSVREMPGKSPVSRLTEHPSDSRETSRPAGGPPALH